MNQQNTPKTTQPDEPIKPILFGSTLKSEGLTKREYFAAMALQGLLSSDAKDTEKRFAMYSVDIADALINALNATK